MSIHLSMAGLSDRVSQSRDSWVEKHGLGFQHLETELLKGIFMQRVLSLLRRHNLYTDSKIYLSTTVQPSPNFRSTLSSPFTSHFPHRLHFLGWCPMRVFEPPSHLLLFNHPPVFVHMTSFRRLR